MLTTTTTNALQQQPELLQILNNSLNTLHVVRQAPTNLTVLDPKPRPTAPLPRVIHRQTAPFGTQALGKLLRVAGRLTVGGSDGVKHARAGWIEQKLA